MIASVNGKEINRKEVERELDQIIMHLEDKLPPEEIAKARPELWKQAVENLINQQMLLQTAEKENIGADQKEVDSHINEIIARFPSREVFFAQLEDMGTSEDEIRREITEELKIAALLDKSLGAPEHIDSAEVETFYRENQDIFMMPERVRASHILRAVKPEDGPQDRANKRLEMSRLRGDIMKGALFGKMAEQFSDCPSKKQGGDLGYFERGRMVKPFEDAAFSLNAGELSDVVETDFGFHLIKLVDRQAPSTVPLEEAQDEVMSFLNHQKKEQTLGDYLRKLRGTYQIVYGEERE